jgi:hypothetical protein
MVQEWRPQEWRPQEWRPLAPQRRRVHKTYQERLRETAPDSRPGAGAGGGALALPRALQHGLGALEQRSTAWERCRVSISRYEQEAEVTTIRAAFPDSAAIHSHVLHDVLHDVLSRLDKTYQAFFRAFFRRLQRVEGEEGEEGEEGVARRPGSPASRAGIAPTRFVHLQRVKRMATARSSITGSWCGPRSDAAASTGPVHSRARPRGHAHEGHAQSGGCWLVRGRLVCAGALSIHPLPLPQSGQERGIEGSDLGLASFATLADGTMRHTPRCSRTAEA